MLYRILMVAAAAGLLAVGACSVINKPDNPVISGVGGTLLPLCPDGSEPNDAQGTPPFCCASTQSICLCGQGGGSSSGGDALVDVSVNTQNCGKCGNACPSGQNCVMGKCQAPCGGSSTPCGNLCVDTKVDPANCGGCGTKCAAPVGGLPLCVGGKCSFECSAPVRACDIACKTDPDCANAANPSDSKCDPVTHTCGGCSTDTSVDQNNCGACGVACPMSAPHASPVCNKMTDAKLGSYGQCMANCDQGFTDCDGSLADGCEANTDNDPKNCGKCGTICPAGMPVCFNGACQAGLSIQVDGHAPVLVACSPGDFKCEAQQVCNQLTKEMCVFQTFDDCGNQGSWYPPSAGPGAQFYFAIQDMPCGWGNILGCQQADFAKYMIQANHPGICGPSGHWQRQ